MQTLTQDGVTIEFSDTLEPGTTTITYRVDQNTGREKTVTFYLRTTHGATATLTFVVACAS